MTTNFCQKHGQQIEAGEECRYCIIEADIEELYGA